MVRVLADKYLYQLASFLPVDVQLDFYDPEYGLPDSIDGIDALLIRTVTTIDEELLDRLPDSVKFIGTGSAGTDHVDTELLRERNIVFCSAAGCNARSVAEYVITAMLIWADHTSQLLPECRVGIVGAGHVGSAVKTMLERLDIPVIVYDPPRASREQDFITATLEEVLNADILSFHTPLTTTGPHPTKYWLDTDKLGTHKYGLIINTARGGVIEEEAVLRAHANGTVQNLIIDVWENEPVFNDELARVSFIKTPHIAGYSVQAKLQASRIICEEMNAHFGLDHPIRSTSSSNKIPVNLPNEIEDVTDIMGSLHPLLQYQRELTSLIGLPDDQKAYHFNKIRSESPLRDEFTTLQIPPSVVDRFPFLQIITT